MSFSKDNEAYLRSQGYSGTRFDSPRDSDLVEKNKHLYDSIIQYAGDDGELSKDEYEKIYTDRGPWGKYAYNQDSVADAVARAAVDKGFKVNQDTLDRHDLAYDGDDIMSKIYQGDFAPDMKDKDKYSYERSIEENDDAWNVFRYKGGAATAEPDPVTPDPVTPDPVTPDPVTPDPTDPYLTDKRKEWDETTDPTRTPTPKVGGRGMQDYMPIQMDRWMNVGANPGRRLGVDLTPMEQLGSIPFVTAGQYDQSLNKVTPTLSGGRFYGFLKNEPGSASSLASGLIDDMKKTI